MPNQILNNGETNLSLRTKINENFIELYSLISKLSSCCPEPNIECFPTNCPFAGNISFDVVVGSDSSICRVVGLTSGAIFAPGLGGQQSTARIIGMSGDTKGYPSCCFEGLVGYFYVDAKKFIVGEQLEFINWNSVLPTVNGVYTLESFLYEERVIRVGCSKSNKIHQ
jgi:hypothetical protein